KLSKRDADRLGFPIFPLTWQDPETKELAVGYKEAGYLPEAFINFLAFLGWNPGSTQEVFSMEELIREFSLERINKAGARFDIQKAQWYNQHYLRQKPVDELAGYLLASLAEQNISCSQENAVKIADIMRDRVTFPQDFWEQGRFFFSAPDTFDQAVARKKWTADAVKALNDYRDAVDAETDWSAEKAKSTLE